MCFQNRRGSELPKITKRIVDAAKPGEKEFFVWDSEMRPFGLRVLPTGRKSYVIHYRKNGRYRRLTIGQHGVLAPGEARDIAREHLVDVARGGDPSQQRRIERRAPNVAALSDRLIREHAIVRLKPSTQGEYERCVRLFIKPAIGSFKVAAVTRTDIAQLHHQMRHIPYQANRVLGVMSKMFNLAEIWGLRPDGSNPCRHIAKYPERKRERFLSRDELRTLAEVLEQAEIDGSESKASITAIRLLVLTGCRLGEIQRLRWDYMDGSYIVLPDSKTGPRRIPLTPSIRHVLAGIDREKGNPFVIQGKLPGSHLTDLQHPWRRIRGRAGLNDVRIHDLRHTYASHAIAAGMSLQLVGKLLGHTQVQTTARYAHLADDHVKEAAEQLSNQLATAIL